MEQHCTRPGHTINDYLVLGTVKLENIYIYIIHLFSILDVMMATSIYAMTTVMMKNLMVICLLTRMISCHCKHYFQLNFPPEYLKHNIRLITVLVSLKMTITKVSHSKPTYRNCRIDILFGKTACFSNNIACWLQHAPYKHPKYIY